MAVLVAPLKEKKKQDRPHVRTIPVGSSSVRYSPKPAKTTQRPAPKIAVTKTSSGKRKSKAKTASKPVAQQVAAWEDDPMSGAPPVTRPLPDLTRTPLRVAIGGAAPAPRVYPRGTAEFRYWAAADALSRGGDFWRRILPPTARWQPGETLEVTLDAGDELNAYYDRGGLRFFHATAGGQRVYSGESPDVVCHEMGHAILDLIRPDLWNVMSGEVAAFHESFGDMSAILVAIQLPALRRELIAGGPPLYRTSRLSRLAEQLGWAIRQRRPDGAAPDCLRNAVNSFFYRPLGELPTLAPDAQLSSEPHSFSRVFTAGFFEALSNMVETAGGMSDDNLLTVAETMAKLLVQSAANAPIVPEFYSQVAAHIVSANAAAAFRDALKSAFVRRGILSLASAYGSGPGLVSYTTPGIGAASAGMAPAAAPPYAPPPRLLLSGTDFGVGPQSLLVQPAGQEKRFAVAPASTSTGPVPQPSQDQSAREFLSYLFRRGRVDLGNHGEKDARVTHPFARKTHELATADGGLLTVERKCFDCGLD